MEIIFLSMNKKVRTGISPAEHNLHALFIWIAFSAIRSYRSKKLFPLKGRKDKRADSFKVIGDNGFAYIIHK